MPPDGPVWLTLLEHVPAVAGLLTAKVLIEFAFYAWIVRDNDRARRFARITKARHRPPRR